jgi:hypothetical protein
LPPTCVERIPEGKERPLLVERFPDQGMAGHSLVLNVEITHGLGERVLPAALQIQSQSEGARWLEQSGFRFPDPKGPGRPQVRRSESANAAVTRLQLPLLALPDEPGRKDLILPPLPIALSRASGEVFTLCTQPHRLTLVEPIENVPNPTPKENPAPERQREFWVALRNAVYGGLAALAVATLAYFAFRAWRRRPRPLPPPPPPRPPWEVALEALAVIRAAHLIEQGRLDEHYDRVCNTFRRYLGDRFGFDGLESTSPEILARLQSHPQAARILAEVRSYLEESDLVKFADLTPTQAQCHGLLEQSEALIRNSTPGPENALGQPEGR